MSIPPGATKRLLNTHTSRLHTDDDPIFLQDPRYAILSHRWFHKEITLDMLESASLQDPENKSPQNIKLRRACEVARDRDLAFIWIDSCCIYRADAVELRTTINSMFQFYRKAEICLTYLSDVLLGSGGSKEENSTDDNETTLFRTYAQDDNFSEWFDRGWTLQELFAPTKMEFFDMHWQSLGTRQSRAAALSTITGIPTHFLNGQQDFRKASIAAKMSWQSRRKTTKSEDMAYSMLGIFGVKLGIVYGRGMNAFRDLQMELMSTSTDESIFAWMTPVDEGLPYAVHPESDRKHDEWGILAPSPKCFEKSGDVVPRDMGPRIGGYHLDQGNIKFPVAPTDFYPHTKRKTGMVCLTLFLPCIVFPMLVKTGQRQTFDLSLNCYRGYDQERRRPVQVSLCRRVGSIQQKDFIFRRQRCEQLRTWERALQSWAKMDAVTLLQPHVED